MQQFLTHPLFVLFLTGLTVVIGASLFRSLTAARQIDDALADSTTQTASQQQKIQIVEKKLEEAKSPLSKEKRLRDELLYQKSGEYILQIPDQPVTSLLPTPSPSPVTPWGAWQALLFEE